MPGRDRRPPPTLRHGAVNFGLPLSRRNLEGSLRSRRSLGSRRPLPFPGSAYGAQPYRGAAPGPPPPPPPAGSGYYPPPPAPYGAPGPMAMPPPQEKSVGAAYGLWLLGLIGFPGIHRLYLGYTGSGIAMLLMVWIGWVLLLIPTLIAVIWWLIDLALIPGMAEPRPPMMQAQFPQMPYQQMPPPQPPTY